MKTIKKISKINVRCLKRHLKQIKDFNYHYLDKEIIINLIEINLFVFVNFIKNNPLIFMEDKYDTIIDEYLYKILQIQLFNIVNLENEKDIKLDCNQIIIFVKNLFNAYILPCRSYKNTFCRLRPNLLKIEKQLEYLINVYQPEQRTDEWYKFRHNTLTASNIWKIFKSEYSRNQLIFEKCEPIKEFNKPNINSPMHWGQKYEPVSIMIYEKLYNTTISDFGCIPHKKYNFLAASPDGINTDKNSYLYGRMLEIKNVVSRDINGIPKSEYWIQMQLQMEVCELNECDFLETKFNEYITYEEFIEDGNYNYSLDNKYKGIILVFEKENEDIYFKYKPLDMLESDFNIWKKNIIDNTNDTLIREIYWKLDVISCILVLRNKFWFNQVLPIINNFWETLSREKIEGYQHRAPKKRIIKKQNTCLIDNSLFT
jgi:putative phage-type endonuclease